LVVSTVKSAKRLAVLGDGDLSLDGVSVDEVV